jgi:hypothetical protein
MPSPTLLRKGVAGLATLAFRDLNAAWRDAENTARAGAVLRDTLPAVIETYGAAAATLAADWYDESRDEAEVRRFFQATPATIEQVGADSLIAWATAEATDVNALRVLIEGGTQRRIANFSRLTVTESALADPAATGWQRVGAGSCAFCQMLISRGAVYSEATADFASHDHCKCAAVPAWGGAPLPVKPYTPSAKKGSDADRARVRAYLRANA